MKIKGFGGVFLRTGNLEEIKKWYSDVLKINLEEWNGTIIKPEPGTETIFSLFADDDNYFPAEQPVMLNFQVENLDDCIGHLEKLGVPYVKDKTVSEYGKFAWIEDPLGRRIELWEK
ncbi:VOC family protein [Falsibacillus pallidus]|uniref:Putative enzyme related to lactoylglutathione lyase n=1 Tax=Falsibacillus pallidus TaxID=493781 RepID=A0A370GQM4_9BACI|nr:VOC family protein [Falsibacillus pallidus]RDI45556.1 putative enzyme related to lactoylglutathione lyase [Falsibacillus pallidus]